MGNALLDSIIWRSFTEEYFEWSDLFEAVIDSGPIFTFVEVGAGYGRWSSYAAAAAAAQGKEIRLGMSEAEPNHAHWLREQMAKCGIGEDRYWLLEAATGAERRKAVLSVGMPSGNDAPEQWYGQSIDFPPGDLRVPIGEYYGRPMSEAGGFKFIEVDEVPLSDLLDRFEFVDLMDMDIQGAEAAAIRGSLDALNAVVRRAHIETHNHEVEAELRVLLSGAGWVCARDLPCWTNHETIFGTAYFEGGVQTWLNPRLF